MNNIKGNKVSNITHVHIQSTQLMNISNKSTQQKHKKRLKHRLFNKYISSSNISQQQKHNSIKLNDNNQNRAVQLPNTTSYLKSSETSHYRKIPIWYLFLLILGILAISIVIAVIITMIVSIFKARPSSITTSVITSSTTSVTSTSTTSATSTTTSSSTSTTTTTFYTCSNFTVTPNWDYPYNDISNRGSQTFGSCCEWCLNTTTCNAFILNSYNTCIIKTSKGSGGTPYANCIGAAR